jgi:hypothetical protein
MSRGVDDDKHVEIIKGPRIENRGDREPEDVVDRLHQDPRRSTSSASLYLDHPD